MLYTTIDTLNFDILLGIFECYRLDDEENWNLQLFHLNMYIPLTKGSRTLDLLTHLPLLPLVVDYRSGDAGEDNRAILYAIQQRDRIFRIVFQAPSSILHKLTMSMDEPFPRLETLSLLSMAKPEEGTELILASTLLAPNLRHLTLRNLCLPTGLQLLTSALSLVTLDLTDIQAPGSLSPEHLVVHIRLMARLEELSVSFTIPVPRPRAEGELLRAPKTSVTLPSLKQFRFRGVAAYLESLVARIRAPLLQRFSIILFNQLAFTLPRLSRFINAQEGLGYRTASVKFDHEAVSIAIRHPMHLSDGVFDLDVRCNQFDWQVDSVGQVCGALLPVLFAAETLALYFYGPTLPSKWQGGVGSTVWHDLLLPFNGVKKLWIDTALSLELSSALQPDEGLGSSPDRLLPELRELETKLEIGQAKNAFTPFLDARRLAGHPVDLCTSQPVFIMPLSDTMTSLPEIRSEQIRKRIFTHSSLAENHRYNFQAPESDPSPDNEE